MKNLVFCTIIFLVGLMSCVAGARVKENVTCPEDFENIHRQCFRFINETKKWEDALEFCRTLNSDLASLEALQEKEAVNEFIKEKYETATNFWFGYRKRTVTGNHEWEWIPSELVVQDGVVPWLKQSYKRKSGKRYCGGILFTPKPPSKRRTGTMYLNNERCTKKQFFVCEHHPPKVSPTTPTTTIIPTTITTTTTATTTIAITTTPNTTPISVPVVEKKPERPSTARKTSSKGQISLIGDQTIVSGVTQATVVTRSTLKDKTLPTTRIPLPHTWPFKPRVLPSEVDDSGEDEVDHMTTAEYTNPGDLTTAQPTQHSTTETEDREDTTKTRSDLEKEMIVNITDDSDEDVTGDDLGDDGGNINVTDDEDLQTSESPDSSGESTTTNSKTAEVDDETTDNAEDEEDDTTTSTTTTATTTRKQIPRYNVKTDKPRVDWQKEFLPYQGCYVPGLGSSLKRLVLSARDFYSNDRESCPAVKLRRLSWPDTEAGETALVPCRRGRGFATFRCDEDQICWMGQPDTTDCASSRLKSLLKRVETRAGKGPRPTPGNKTETGTETETHVQTEAPPTVQESVELTSQLVQVTAEEEETTMDDVIVTSQVMTALTDFSSDEGPGEEDQEEVEKIVENVVKAGSNLVSEKKQAMWQEMTPEDKVRSASTLLVAMETATTSMAEKIEEPTVMEEKNEDVEMELRVLDIATMEKEKQKELIYDSDQSENTFSIPVKTLKKFSNGRLAKTVFMTHYSMSDILGGRKSSRSARRGGHNRVGQTDAGVSDNNSEDPKAEGTDKPAEEEDEVYDGPKIASYILSASIGVEGHITELPEPVTFTMRHVVEIDERHIPLCSFWNVSEGMSQGFWSQVGCRVVRTNRTHTKCECDHLTNFAVLMDIHGVEMTAVHQSILRTVTIIGCCISCAALLASFLTFMCFTSLQGERNTIHKNLSLCLLLAELLFVCGIDQAEYQVGCAVIAGFLHFLFLAAFTWMFLEGVHIIIMLVQVFEAAKSRLPYYYITGYGVPTAIVGVSLLFYHEGYGTEKFCWLTTERYFILSFAGPVGLILLVNSIFLSYALTTVCRHADYVFSTKEKTTGSGLRSWVQGALALEVLLGLTWLFGYFLINDNSMPIAYIFTVLNSLQGLFIFIFHCLLSKKTQKEYSQVMKGMKVKRSSSMRGVTSTNTRRTSSSQATNSTNNHNHPSRHVNNSSNDARGNQDKVEMNHNTEDHQRLYIGSDAPSNGKDLQNLPV